MTGRAPAREVCVRRCPKCGRPVTEADVICPGCDFVLDTSFLGEDITDDRAPPPPVVEDHSMFGEDAVILGSGVGGEFESFEAEDTGMVQREVTNARIYVGGQTQALLAWDAIPGVVEGVDAEVLRLSPYEKHVLQFVNGRRPVGRIRKKSGMEEPELKLALAMMADKGIIQKVGVVDEERKARARARRREKLGKSTRKKKRSSKSRSKAKPSTRTSAEGEAADKTSAKKKRTKEEPSKPSRSASAKPEPKSPPASEATRVEAMPASLIDALRKGESVDARASEPEEHSGFESETLSTETTPAGGDAAGDEGAAGGKRKRRRPRLPPKMRRSLDSQPPLSEVSGLAEVSKPGVSVPDRKPIIGGVEPTSIRKAPLADDGDDVDDVFSSSTEHAAARAAADNDFFLEDQSAAPPSAQQPAARADAALPAEATSDVPTDSVAPLAPTAADDPPPSLADDAYDEAAEGFEAPDATVALDAANFSLDMPSIEVVDPDRGLPPPLPGDHSMVGGEVVEDLHDMPTGPVLQLPPGGSGVDDSLLPTGESPDAEPAPAARAFGDEDARSATDADDVLSLPSGAIQPLPTFEPPATPAPPLPGAVASLPPAELTPLPGMAVHPPAAPVDPAPDAAELAELLGDDDDDDDDDLLAIDDDDDDVEDAAAAAPAPAAAPAADDDDDVEEALADDSDEGDPVEVSFEMQRKAAKIFEQAEEDWSKNNKGSARMNAKLAMIYDPSNKRYKNTLAEWEKQSAAEPKQAGKLRQDVRLFEEARLAESRGQFEKACRLLQKAIDLNPRAAPVYNLLGVIQATRLKQYKEASDNLLKACDLAPSNLSFKNNLGKVLGMQEGARDKSKIDRKQDEDMVKVRKIRPKFF